MLSEVIKVKQLDGEPRRRWFAAPDMDVFVWFNDDEDIIQFQICYDKGPDEQALTWHFEQGISHKSVDDGENRSFRMKSTPIMDNESEYDLQRIVQDFESRAGDIDHKTVSFILEHLQAGN